MERISTVQAIGRSILHADEFTIGLESGGWESAYSARCQVSS